MRMLYARCVLSRPELELKPGDIAKDGAQKAAQDAPKARDAMKVLREL